MRKKLELNKLNSEIDNLNREKENLNQIISKLNKYMVLSQEEREYIQLIW